MTYRAFLVGTALTIAGQLAFAQTPGDLDGDGDIDTYDLLTLESSRGSFLPKVWQGDLNDDGQIDDVDVLILNDGWTGVMTAGVSADPRDTSNVDLVYQAATGHVFIEAFDTPTNIVLSFVVQNSDNSFRVENAVFPFINTGTNTDREPFQIGQTDALGLGVGPIVNLGEIFPAGMDLQLYADYLTLAQFASDLGVGGDFDLFLCTDERCFERTGARFSAEVPTHGDQPSLIYNPHSGDLWIKSNRYDVASFVLTNHDGSFNVDNLSLPFANSGRNTDIHPSQIGQIGGSLSGFHRLGPILPQGMSQDDIDDYFTIAESLSSSRRGGRGRFDIRLCEREDCLDHLPNPDLDLDGDVDMLDLTVLRQHLRTFGGATNAQGDVDRDGRVTDEDESLLLRDWTGATTFPSAPLPGNAVDGANQDLIYSPADGEVWIGGERQGYVSSFVFATADGSFRLDELQLPFDDTTQVLEDIFPQLIGQAALGREGVPAFHSLGNIFPTGLADSAALQAYLGVAQYAGGPEGGGGFDLLVCTELDCSDKLPTADLDEDGDVDSRDLVIVTVSLGNRDPSDRGDANRNGEVDRDDRDLVDAGWTGVTVPTESRPPFNAADTAHGDLIYSPFSGEAWLKPPRGGPSICAFVLGSTDGAFQLDQLRLPFADDGRNTDIDRAQVGQAINYSSDDRCIPDSHSLGQILPPGLDSHQQLHQFLTIREYAADYSSPIDGTLDLLLCDSEDCLELLPNGDIDADGDVDTADMAIISSAVYRGQQSHREGDADRNGVIEIEDKEVVIEQWTGVRHTNAEPGAGSLVDRRNADLVYNPFTGDVWLDSDRHDRITDFVLGSADGSFSIDVVRFPERDSGNNTDRDPRQIGQIEISIERHQLGPIFPEGMTSAAQLSDYLTMASYGTRGSDSGMFDLLICETELCRETLGGNPSDRTAADLNYNPFTGSVTIDLTDTGRDRLLRFRLGNDEGRMRPENAELPFPDDGTNTVNSRFEFSQHDPRVQGFEYSVLMELGAVLPAGITFRTSRIIDNGRIRIPIRR